MVKLAGTLDLTAHLLALKHDLITHNRNKTKISNRFARRMGVTGLL